VLGERTFERIDPDWPALIPEGRIEVQGEILAGGLTPDGPIPDGLAATIPTHQRTRLILAVSWRHCKGLPGPHWGAINLLATFLLRRSAV